MSDRELLELAAKAAGYSDAEYQDGGDWMETRYGFREAVFSDKLHEECGSGYWNPLTDDGDALRLAVKLQMTVQTTELKGTAYFAATEDDNWREVDINNQCDPAAATRRAIVLSAAAIGKATP